MHIRRIACIAAWAGLALITLVTVSPIDVRPSTVSTTDLDRAFAFLVMSGLFVVAYPRRVVVISIALFAGAFLIELTQFVSVTRHPQMHDAVVKALGVILGVCGGVLTDFVAEKATSATEPDGS